MSEQRQQGYGRGDGLGTWAPIGGGGGEKELINMPKDVQSLAPAASILLRGRTTDNKLAGLYGLAATLLGDYKPGLTFIANMQGAQLGVRGLARSEYNMALTRMLVPTSMPSADVRQTQRPPAEAGKRSKRNGTEDDE